jgi:hypothetical protein
VHRTFEKRKLLADHRTAKELAMADYNISLYLAGGATATIKQTASMDDAALHTLETELKKPACVLKDRDARIVLTVKNPEVNVIAYSVDRIGG